MIIIPVIIGMKTMMLFINSYKNGVWEKYFHINQNPLQESWELILNIGKNPYEEKLPKIPNWLSEKLWWYLSLWYWSEEYIIYAIDHKEIRFVKKYGDFLIGNHDHPYVTSTDHKYFIINDDLFDQILATDQNNNIALKIMIKDVLLSSIKYSSTDSSTKSMKRSETVLPCHILQKKIMKTVNDY